MFARNLGSPARAITTTGVAASRDCATTELIVVANIDKPNFDQPRGREGFRARRARIGHQLGTERIGISLGEKSRWGKPWGKVRSK